MEKLECRIDLTQVSQFVQNTRQRTRQNISNTRYPQVPEGDSILFSENCISLLIRGSRWDLQNVVDTGSPCIAVNAKVQTDNRTERESEGRVEAHREVELTLLFVAKATRIYTGARTVRSRSSINYLAV